MNGLVFFWMQIGLSGRRWVAVAGWIFVALPCLAVAGVTGVLAVLAWGPAMRAAPTVAVEGTVESTTREESTEGNATRKAVTLAYRYEFRGARYLGLERSDSHRYQNEGSRRYEEEREAWMPSQAEAPKRPGDRVTVYVDPESPSRSSLGRAPTRAEIGGLLLESLSAAAAGLLLTWMGWHYVRHPVEIVLATPSRVDALMSASPGQDMPPPVAPSGEEEISADVACVRRGGGTTRIAFRPAAGPALPLSGLFPPVLLLVVLVAAVSWGAPQPDSTRGGLAYLGIAVVTAFIAWSLAYGRARRELVIRGGAMDIATSWLAGRRRRVTRAQIDRLESHWALSEVSRAGEVAYFDLQAVLGNGRRVTVAEGLPGAEAADATARFVARELGLAPEQVLGAGQVRRLDRGIAREALAPKQPADRIAH